MSFSSKKEINITDSSKTAIFSWNMILNRNSTDYSCHLWLVINLNPVQSSSGEPELFLFSFSLCELHVHDNWNSFFSRRGVLTLCKYHAGLLGKIKALPRINTVNSYGSVFDLW